MDGPLDPVLLKKFEQFVELRNATEGNISKTDLIRATIDQDIEIVSQDDIDELKYSINQVQRSLDAAFTRSDQFSTVMTTFLGQLRQTATICLKFGPGFDGISTLASISEQVYDLERVFADYLQKMERFRKGYSDVMTALPAEETKTAHETTTMPPDLQQKANKITEKINKKILELSKRILYFQKALNAVEKGQRLPAEEETDHDDTALRMQHLSLEVPGQKTSPRRRSVVPEESVDIVKALAEVSLKSTKNMRKVGAITLKPQVQQKTRTDALKVESRDEILARILTPKKVAELKPQPLRLSQQSPSVLQLVIQAPEPAPAPPLHIPLSQPTTISQAPTLSQQSLFSTPKALPKELHKDEPREKKTHDSKPDNPELLAKPTTTLFTPVKKEEKPQEPVKSEAPTVTSESSVFSKPSTETTATTTVTTTSALPASVTTTSTGSFSFAPATTAVATSVTSSEAAAGKPLEAAVSTAAPSFSFTSTLSSQPQTTSSFSFNPAPTPAATTSSFAFNPSAPSTTTSSFTFKPAEPQKSAFGGGTTATAPGSFSFKPAQPAGNDDGMEDDTSGTAPATSTANNFNFASTGLGQSGPQNRTGGGFQSLNFSTLGQNKPAFASFTPTQQPAASTTGGFASFGSTQPAPTGSGFGAAPSFGSGPAFGSGSVFGGGTQTSSVFGGKPVFGGGTQAQSTPTNTGFAAFAGKGSSFGQLAQSPPQSNSLFGGQQSTGFSSFGSTNSTTPNNPAFTAFRK
uniref:Nuclear pore complex protein Nup214 n=2 Tax=Bursaphelenchus xylophilus TaxID=6326 RepID=A0A1I7S972_BURXY